MVDSYCRLPTDENSAIEIRPSDIPTSKREEEVDQNELDETVEDHLDDNATMGASGRVKIMTDATNNETDTESMNNIRMVNDRLEDEFWSQDCNTTDSNS